jgi:hypothetical protein
LEKLDLACQYISITPNGFAPTNVIVQLAMHDAWNFNTTTAQKVVAYKNISNIVQSMRDISPNSGAYFVSVNIVRRLTTDFKTSQNEGDLYESNHTRAHQT